MYKTTKILPVFTDERGTITDILEGQNINHIGMITSNAGAIRGKHYHKKSIQYIYVLSGKLESFTQDLSGTDKTIKSNILVSGDLETIPPMVVHAHKAVEDSIFLDFTTESRESGKYELDTFRVDMDIK